MLCWVLLPLVLCYRSSFAGINDDLDPLINEVILNKLQDKYFEFASWTKCKLLKLNVDDENLNREINEVLKFMKML